MHRLLKCLLQVSRDYFVKARPIGQETAALTASPAQAAGADA
jgi:hypothetical protein